VRFEKLQNMFTRKDAALWAYTLNVFPILIQEDLKNMMALATSGAMQTKN